ncbi:hypothetical protein [Streptomyces subrutilus]|uniref:aromatic-ring hydroxylase C-terminal domain-containing protein n=1 Tax=Streptomyces subrutilus TaxID=36818 RepID=UPI00340C4E6D
MTELPSTGGRDVRTVRFPTATPPAADVSAAGGWELRTLDEDADGVLARVADVDPGLELVSATTFYDATTLHDRIGDSFALLVLGEDRAVEREFAARAARRGLPFTVIHLTDPGARAVYGAGHVLVRPDQHLAWRGTVLPEGGAAAVPDRVLGHGAPAAASRCPLAAGGARTPEGGRP